MWNIIESQTDLFNLIYQLIQFENNHSCRHNGTVWAFVSKSLRTTVLYYVQTIVWQEKWKSALFNFKEHSRI